MRAIIVCGLIAVAIVATLACLPVSSWIFKNQMDLVFRNTRSVDLGYYGEVGPILPGWLNDPNTYTGNNPAEEITRALNLHNEERSAALKAYNEKHPQDALGWAITVRMTCMAGSHAPDEPKSKDLSWLPKLMSNLDTGINACLKGEILEPNNAYFPLMRAEFLMEQNKLAEMRSALASAASRTRYDSHISDEAMAMERAQVLAKGYRGELVRTGVDASVLLPDFAHIKGLARYINRNESLQAKRDLISALHAMAAGEQTMIGFLVAAASLDLAICPPVPIKSNQIRRSDAELLQFATNFDSRLAAAKISPPTAGTLTTFNMLRHLVHASHKYIEKLPSIFAGEGDDNRTAQFLFAVTIAPYCLLFGLLFSFVVAILPWSLSRINSDSLSDLAPQLIGLPVWFATETLRVSCCDNSSSGSGLAIAIAFLILGALKLPKRPAMISNFVFGICGMVTILSTSLVSNNMWIALGVFALAAGFLPLFLGDDLRKKFALIGSVILVIMSFLASDLTALVVAICFAITYGLTLKNKKGETPKISEVLTIIVYVIVCGVMGIVVTVNGSSNAAASTGFLNVWEEVLKITGMRNGQASSNVLAAIIIGLVLGILFQGKGTKVTRSAICISWITFSSLYLVMSGLQLRENNRLSSGQTNLVNEANNIRKIAGQIAR